jgi:hypothetical protein
MVPKKAVKVMCLSGKDNFKLVERQLVGRYCAELGILSIHSFSSTALSLEMHTHRYQGYCVTKECQPYKALKNST